MNITFNNKKTFNIGNSIIILINNIKKSQFFNTNIKNKNKKKKNNQKTRHNNNNISQLCIYFYSNKNCLAILKTHIYLCRAN